MHNLKTTYLIEYNKRNNLDFVVSLISVYLR